MSRNISILVVDDNQINRQYFSMALKKFGYKVILAEDGFEAIEIADKYSFDLIFMDIRMPEIDGYDCAKKIRQQKLHKSTPIIAISAENLLTNKTHAFNGFILKPASPKLLKDTVVNYCHEEIETHHVFDRNKALKFAYNDEDIMKKIISLFIEEIPKQVNELDAYIKEKDRTKCLNNIHKFRGSCQSCGAKVLESELKNLSAIIEHETWTQINFDNIKSSARDFIQAVTKVQN